MSTKRYNVFVGSTYQDLKEYRKAVENAILCKGMYPIGMEYFGASEKRPIEECLENVRKSDVYVGLFAARYGSIDTKTGKSFTQLEFEEAENIGLPCYAFFMDLKKQKIFYEHVDFGEKFEKLEGLKKYIQLNLTVATFTTPEDLGAKVMQSLDKFTQNIKKKKTQDK
jgi:hypothetical protein